MLSPSPSTSTGKSTDETKCEDSTSEKTLEKSGVGKVLVRYITLVKAAEKGQLGLVKPRVKPEELSYIPETCVMSPLGIAEVYSNLNKIPKEIREKISLQDWLKVNTVTAKNNCSSLKGAIISQEDGVIPWKNFKMKEGVKFLKELKQIYTEIARAHKEVGLKTSRIKERIKELRNFISKVEKFSNLKKESEID